MYLQLHYAESGDAVWLRAERVIGFVPEGTGSAVMLAKHSNGSDTWISVREAPGYLLTLLGAEGPAPLRLEDDTLGVAVCNDLRDIHSRLEGIERVMVDLLDRVQQPPPVAMRFYTDDPKLGPG